MKVIKRILGVAVITSCMIITGCSSLTPTQKGAVVGGVGGGGAGALWAQHAHDSTINSWQGAGIGVAAGALTGALIGDTLNEYKVDSVVGEKDAEIDELQRQLASVEVELNRLLGQTEQSDVQVDSVDGQLRFTILNEVLFGSGRVDIKKESKSVLDSILTVIEQDYANREIYVEGHTDTDPIQKSEWANNRELSYHRSMAVINYFVEEKMVSPERFKAVACGQFHPAVPNDSEANKRLNRRAVIVVMPERDVIVVDTL